MPFAIKIKQISVIVGIFLLAVLLPVSTAHAKNTEALFQDMQLASHSKDKIALQETLSQYIQQTNELVEEEYTSSSAEVSAFLRETNEVEASIYVAKWLSSEDADTLKTAVRYRWMMITSYDLMFFSQFASASNMIEKSLSSIKIWQPLSDSALNTQANLYHIYGQLLVKQKRVAEALPYFFQAEEWFKNIQPDHPSIFTINIILGEAFLNAKDYIKAEQYTKQALNIIPNGRVDAISYLYGILASAVRQQARPEDALDIIHQYLKNPVDPRKDYFLYFSLVHIEILRDLQAFEAALALAKETHTLAQAVNNKSYLKEAKRHLGFLESHFGNTVAAEKLLFEAIHSATNKLNDTSPEVYLEYVEILEKLGKYQIALEYHQMFHATYVKERDRIDRATIANLEQQQRNFKLEQETIVSSTKLALAEANSKRAQFKSRVLMWYATILVLIMTVVLIMFIQLRKKSHELHYMAKHDQLTGLGNRHAFLQALKASPFHLLIVTDIDRLKYYNDLYGHQKGDLLIQGYAKHVTHLLKPEGAQIFRIGGDEFAILIKAPFSVRKIEDGISRAILQLQKNGFTEADASYGIATRDEVKTDFDWISLADQRMYQMKQSRKA
ncbi:tetratricopeptide repeat-containing diguanylate cyclase [Marinomonas sp. GJ51-6]|uniref:tetratricopeptide repeat-containing diguanylate cyclase n=1 Tax=Marinomonas sp. GJ51-6 TaxID=2992802 RepID=UPI002934FBC0|nr:tetratricopeptide repeat-containing diguanylate cyclase [Marinomonas sp. GJ51-6]WOD07110.1 tetratricopeptide repeat-containing diguanylate cyclase [Marinomonas sp. GJ51-6]